MTQDQAPHQMRAELVTLEGEWARLESLGLEHAEALFAAAQDPDAWRYVSTDASVSPDAMRQWIATALAEQAVGQSLPFAIVRRADGAVVGSTRYLDIRPAHCGLEIGWTWLTPSARRTAINTECKYLLLGHAFERLGAIRVQLKTDRRNERSQRAIERLGAVHEGMLRKHLIYDNGYQRDSVMYSITDDEWPAVKANLEAKLRAR
ncbi:MAG TPA: GNAT family protein [Ktedonobacterales bacterium]